MPCVSCQDAQGSIVVNFVKTIQYKNKLFWLMFTGFTAGDCKGPVEILHIQTELGTTLERLYNNLLISSFIYKVTTLTSKL